jgi:lipopolysaccharide transport protein LptA
VKSLIIVLAVLIAVGLCVCTIRAENRQVIGGMTLKAVSFEMDENLVIAKGKASLTSKEASVKADEIRIYLEKGKSNKLVLSKATATGNVVIHARQTDQATKTSRVVDATAKSATLVQGSDSLELTGNVLVKVTDPQLEKPAEVSGDKVTVYLQKLKIRVDGTSDKQAEIDVTPVENK